MIWYLCRHDAERENHARFMEILYAIPKANNELKKTEINK